MQTWKRVSVLALVFTLWAGMVQAADEAPAKSLGDAKAKKEKADKPEQPLVTFELTGKIVAQEVKPKKEGDKAKPYTAYYLLDAAGKKTQLANPKAHAKKADKETAIDLAKYVDKDVVITAKGHQTTKKGKDGKDVTTSTIKVIEKVDLAPDAAPAAAPAEK